MHKFLLCLVVPAVFAFPAAASAGELKLSIKDGLVTLIAQDVPLSMVMAEWAKVGQTRVVNGEKVLTPVTLQLFDVPERRALDIILRSASGYMLAERPTPVANASVFDRILILPTSRPPANSPVNTAPAAFNQRPSQVVPMQDMEEPLVNQPPPGPAPMPPGNVPNMQPQTQPGQPGGPLTAPRPGPLPQPQQPVPFGAPPKPPGGGGGGGGAQG